MTAAYRLLFLFFVFCFVFFLFYFFANDSTLTLFKHMRLKSLVNRVSFFHILLITYSCNETRELNSHCKIYKSVLKFFFQVIWTIRHLLVV